MNALKKFLFFCFVFPVSLSLATTGVTAAMKVKLGGGLNFGSYTSDPEPTGVNVDGGLGYAFGGLAGFELSEALDLETGLIYQLYKYELTGTGFDYKANWGGLEVPLLLRYNIGMFSIGAGGFVDFFIGQYSYEQTVLNVKSSGTLSFADANLNTTNFGILLAAGVTFPVSDTLSIYADLRYKIGLNDLDSSSTGKLTSGYGDLMAGVMFKM